MVQQQQPCHGADCSLHAHVCLRTRTQVRVSRLELPQTGSNVLSRLVCRNSDYSAITVHFRLIPADLRGGVDVPYRLRKDGGVLPGSPVFDLQPEQCNHEVLLEVVQGNNVLARCVQGLLPCIHRAACTSWLLRPAQHVMRLRPAANTLQGQGVLPAAVADWHGALSRGRIRRRRERRGAVRWRAQEHLQLAQGRRRWQLRQGQHFAVGQRV